MIGKAVKDANREFSISYTLQTRSLLLGSPWVLNPNLQGAEATATLPWIGKTDQTDNY